MDVRASRFNDPDATVAEFAAILGQHGLDGKRIGFESRLNGLNIDDYEGLRRAVPRAVFVDASGVVFRARLVKSPAEIAYMRQAAEIAKRGIADAAGSVRGGMTDNEIATESGLLLRSGKKLDADIIITATGFNLNGLGDIDLAVDGKPLVFSDTVTYRGMMFTGVPNMAWVFGYFRASWTLRVDLVGDFVCRLLNHMKEKSARKVTPMLRPEDKDMLLLPWIDPENFNPGYLMRGMHRLPKRGDKPEWEHTQDYWSEKDQFPTVNLDDAAFVYE